MRTSRTFPRTMLFPTLLLAAAAGCSGVDAPTGLSASDIAVSAYRSSSIATITVTPSPDSVAVGSSVTLSATMLDASGSVITNTGGLKIHWSSSDTTVAQVDQSGHVTGLQGGAVTISAVVKSVLGKSTMKVLAPSTASTSTTLTASTTTTTTSSTTSSTTGTGLSGLALFSDDFTSYHSTADLMANISSLAGGTGNYQTVLYNDGASANLVTLDTTIRYNGHATMRYSQPAGVASTPELAHWLPSGQGVTKMWLRAKIRFSPGYTTTGTLTNSANAYKMLGWAWDGPNGRGTLEITNTNQYQLYWYVFNSTGQTIAGGNFTSAGTISTEWTDGGWYDYILEYEKTSDTTAISRVWFQKDGAPFTLRAVTTGSGPVGSIPAVRAALVGLNFNQVRTATQSQAVWYGEWEFVDGSQHPNPFNISGF